MATIITDADLKIVAEGPELVLSQPESVLSGMDAWNRKHHGERRLGDRTYISPGNPSDCLSKKRKKERQTDCLSTKLELVDCI
jgi:oligoribonuclease